MTRRVAFVFPGQGSHRAGMASAWDGHPSRGVFDLAARTTGLDLAALADDADTCAASTAIGQPAILTASWAAADALARAGVTPDIVAGHSLGEVSAAAAAGCLDWAQATALVAERGRAMGDACRTTPGAMAAVVRLDPATVESAIADLPDVSIANQNAAEQVVVSGAHPQFDLACEAIRDRGGRIIPLRVEGAFHSPAMAPAVVRVDAVLARTPLGDAQVPLVQGASGSVARAAADVRRGLVDGILSSVRWVAVQERLLALGADVVVEVGPGGVLAAIARRAHPELAVLTCASPSDVDAVVDALAAVPARA